MEVVRVRERKGEGEGKRETERDRKRAGSRAVGSTCLILVFVVQFRLVPLRCVGLWLQG